MGVALVRKSWATLGVGLGLALCLSGCQQLFPRPAYTPPPAPPRPAYPTPRAQIARPTFYVAVKDHLNLRACPGMDCPRIAVLNRNEAVQELGKAGDWSQIRVKSNGSIGWVYSRYLSATPLPELPPQMPPQMAPAPTPAPEITPPPLPAIPEKMKPAPPKPPTLERPPAKPAEGVTPEIKKKPEETKPKPPSKVVAPTQAKPEKPTQVEKPQKPAPPTKKQPTPPPAAPSPEQPSSIRIM